MKIRDLQFDYPDELVALVPQRPPRVLKVQDGEIGEISFRDLLVQIPAGDVLVINNTKVQKRRIFSDSTEILFLERADRVADPSRDSAKSDAPATESFEWDVLFPAKKFKIGDILELPLGVKASLVHKGRPQRLRTDRILDEEYFERAAELPLPPYIQKLRGQKSPDGDRHARPEDDRWYQTAWAKNLGSLAAPTASLHFSAEDLAFLRERGVRVLEVTLHVGLGTFLPVEVEDLSDHRMHSEVYEVAPAVWSEVERARKEGRGVWALGTTVARTLESVARGQGLKTSTQLLLQEGSEFRVVNRLLTNFHQPESTLLALVAGFVGLPLTKKAYKFAVEQRFRLFSYGDLSVWIR